MFICGILGGVRHVVTNSVLFYIWASVKLPKLIFRDVNLPELCPNFHSTLPRNTMPKTLNLIKVDLQKKNKKKLSH